MPVLHEGIHYVGSSDLAVLCALIPDRPELAFCGCLVYPPRLTHDLRRVDCGLCLALIARDGIAGAAGDGRLLTTGEAAAALGVSRGTLQRVHRCARSRLPGAPVNVGSGERAYLRWDPRTLADWFTAASGGPAKRPPPLRAEDRARASVDEAPVDWGESVRALLEGNPEAGGPAGGRSGRGR